MRYEVQITWEDFKAAHWLYMRSGLIGRGIEFVLMVAVFLIVLLSMDFGVGPKTQRMLWLLGGLLAFGAIWFFLVVPYRLRRTYQQQRVFRAPVTYEFTDDAFGVSTAYGQVCVPWKDIVKWKEDERFLLVYNSDAAFNIVPKRIFGSKEEMERVRAILRKGIGVPIA